MSEDRKLTGKPIHKIFTFPFDDGFQSTYYISFEMDETGNFRLVGKNVNTGNKVWGDWTWYQGIAMLKIDHHVFIGVSGYFENDHFPIEQPLLLRTGQDI
jgi:hypothetical protein